MTNQDNQKQIESAIRINIRDQQAAQFAVSYLSAFTGFRDMAGGRLAPADFMAAVSSAVLRFPGNEFYARNFHMLDPLVRMAWVAFIDGMRVGQTGDTFGAFVAHQAIYEPVYMVALMSEGERAALALRQEITKIAQSEVRK